MSQVTARDIAFEVLRAVQESDAYANLLLPARLERARLSAADAALATELTYGTLRMRGYYDRVIELAAARPTTRIDEPVLDVLRLGTHQILGMRVPSHAAVNESVALTRRVAARSATGFVNGVLRTIDRADASVWRERVADSARTADERTAMLSSHPEWVVRAFRTALEREGRAAELDDLLAADNAPPAVNGVALPGLAEVPPALPHNQYSPIGFRFASGDPTRAVRDSGGTLRVQDEGSQLAALALTRAQSPVAGERWLDLCAGPGGKTAVLAADAHAGGAQLVANELVPARVNLVRAALAAVPEPVELVQGDGAAFAEAHPREFDRVLLDAPCMGLGALRRRPEARWRKTPRDVAELTVLQESLLNAAVRAARPGALIAYVTCSPHVAETRGIVDAALRRAGERLQELDARAVLAGVTRHPLDLGGDDLSVQLWPHRHQTDAMFISLLRAVG